MTLNALTLSILVKSNLDIHLEKLELEPELELLSKTVEAELASSESSLARLNPSFSPDCNRDRLEKSWKPDVGSFGYACSS